MRIRTDIHAGGIMDDVAAGVKNAGNVLGQWLQEADDQATQLANDAYFISSSLVDCMNTTLRSRRNR